MYYINENGEILHQTQLQELFSLRWYIQYLIDESDDEFENPLSQENWMLQANWKSIKYVIHNKYSMTPKKLKKKTFKQIIKIQHEKLDTGEGESINDEEESTASTELSEENSISDTHTENTEESKPTETHQVHNVCNKTIHDEDDSSQDKSVTKIEPYKHTGEQNNGKDNKLLTTNFQVEIEN